MSRPLTFSEKLKLQQALNRELKLASPIKEDGRLGDETAAAVRLYQASVGHLVSGTPTDDEMIALGVFTPAPKGTIMQNILINLLSSSVVLGLIRNGLLAAATYFVTKGYFDQGTAEQIVGWVMGGVAVLLSAFSNAEKAGAKQIVKAVEAHPAITVVPPAVSPTGKAEVVVAK